MGYKSKAAGAKEGESGLYKTNFVFFKDAFTWDQA